MQDSTGKAVSPARQLDESEAAILRSRAHRSSRQRFRRRERIARGQLRIQRLEQLGKVSIQRFRIAALNKDFSRSRKINARNPSDFGSKIHVWPAGNSPIRFASISSIGGFTGRCTLPTLLPRSERTNPEDASGYSVDPGFPYSPLTISTLPAGLVPITLRSANPAGLRALTSGPARVLEYRCRRPLA
jgi:hypothetical protein